MVSKKIIYVIVFLFSALIIQAQETKSKLKLKTALSLETRHIWRGLRGGDGPTVCPTLELQKGRFTIGAWGGYAFDDSFHEVDLYMTYTTPEFQFLIYDCYAPNPHYWHSDPLDYNSERTVHMVRTTGRFKGTEQFPVSILASVYVYGDRLRNNDEFIVGPNNEDIPNPDFKEKNPDRNSVYFEIGYHHKLANKEVSYALGMSPGNSIYTDQFNVCNINMTVQDKFNFGKNYALPISTGLTINPAADRVYLNFTISLEGEKI